MIIKILIGGVELIKGLFPSLNGYHRSDLKNDLIASIIVTSLSVPVSMGYAQVAGLTPVYGLYASILPLIVFAFVSRTSQIIFGIGAPSSAITASALVLIGVPSGGSEALIYVPVLSLLTGLFLILFAVFKVGKLISYIPSSVISGFIFGVSVSIMLSQLPKMLGLVDLQSGIMSELTTIFYGFSSINWIAFLISVMSLIIILGGKKIAPKVPFSLFVLIMMTGVSAFFNFNQLNISVIGYIEQGLPQLRFPPIFQLDNLLLLTLGAFSIAVVVSMDSLLTTMAFHKKRNGLINENREMLAYGLSNISSAFSGSAPTSASMSRTAANVEFQGKSQLTSLFSAVMMMLILVFLGDKLYFIPQPVLSAIVFAALYAVVRDEIKEFTSIAKKSKTESYVWFFAMLGVLLIGVIAGILIGLILAVIVVIVVKTMITPSAFLGKNPVDGKWYNIKRNSKAEEYRKIVIYRFSGSLYFLNIRSFIGELLNHIKEDTIGIVIEAQAMTTLDITATKELSKFLEQLNELGIHYYFVNTIGEFRDVIKERKLDRLIGEKHLKKSIDDALILLKDEMEVDWENI